MNYNIKHPEIEDGEMFLSNADEEGYQGIGWKTKRRGNIAFGKSGNRVIGLFPVFVQKQEYDEGMEMKP